MKRIIVFLLGALFLTVTVSAFAEDNIGLIQRLKNKFAKKPAQVTTAAKTAVPSAAKTVKAAVPVPAAVSAPVDRKDFIANIKSTLDTDPEIIPNIAGLKVVKEGGVASYIFNDTSLESLDDGSLQNLANKIIGEVGRVRSEVVNTQMDAARQAQQVQVQLNQVRQAQAASSQAARIQTMPRAPSIPAAAGAPSLPGGGRGATGGPGGPGGPGSAGGRR